MSENPATLAVLLVEDSEADSRLLAHHLRQGGYLPSIRRVESQAEMLEALASETFDVVICDFKLPNFSAPDALATLKLRGHDLPFIIWSGTVGETNVVEAMRAGAHDY